MELTPVNVAGKKPASTVTSIDPDELIENAEAARILRILPQTLSVWRVEKRGPRFLKVGRRVLYRKSDVCTWLAAQLSEVA